MSVFEIDGCIVEIVDSKFKGDINASLELPNKKILRVDIREQEEKFTVLEQESFKKLINNYITKTAFNGLKIVKFDDLSMNQDNLLLKLKKTVLNVSIRGNKISSIIEFLEKKKIINFLYTALGIFGLFVFYQLGYAFLYGYYFGGDSDTYISIIDMFVNPVPINYKSIIGAGIIVLIFAILYLMPLIVFIKSNKKLYNLIFILFGYLFVIAGIIFSINMLFLGESTGEMFTKMKYLIVLLISMPILIILYTYFFKAANKNGLISLSGYFYSAFVFIPILIHYKIESNTFITLFMLFVSPIVSILFSSLKDILNIKESLFNHLKEKINLKLKFILKIIMDFLIILPMPTLALGIIWLAITTKHKNVFLGLCIIVSFIASIVKNVAKNKKIKSNDLRNNDKKDIKEDKLEMTIVASIIIAFLVFSATTIPFLVELNGRIIRLSLIGLSKDKIVYRNIDGKDINTIYGNLVAQNDNTYFISKLPDRNLVSIKAIDVETYPCDKFDINVIPGGLFELRNILNSKYQDLLNNPDVKVEDNIAYHGLVEGDIKIDIKNPHQKNELYNIAQLSVNTGAKEKSSKKSILLMVIDVSTNSYNEKLKYQIESYLIDYKDALIKYFKLPIMNKSNDTAFYTNKKLIYFQDISTIKNTKKEAYVENYYLEPLSE